MKKYIRSITLTGVALLSLCALTLSLHAQDSSGERRSSQDEVTPKGVDKGIRFVFKSAPQGANGTLYMPVNKKDTAEVDIIIGLLSKRVPFPAGRKIMFYAEPPAKGTTPEPGTELFSADLPSGSYDRLIGVVVPDKEKWGIFFLKESDFRVGCIYMKNLTNQAVRIGIGDKDFFTFKPGEERVYGGQSGQASKSTTYTAKMYFQDNKQQWYVGRQFAMQSRKLDAELLLFVWNPTIERVDLQKVVVAPEYVRTPKAIPATPAATPARPQRRSGPTPWDVVP